MPAIVHWLASARPSEVEGYTYCNEDRYGVEWIHDYRRAETRGGRSDATCPACIAIAKTHGCMALRYAELGMAERFGNEESRRLPVPQPGMYLLGNRVPEPPRQHDTESDDGDEPCECDDCIRDREERENV